MNLPDPTYDTIEINLPLTTLLALMPLVERNDDTARWVASAVALYKRLQSCGFQPPPAFEDAPQPHLQIQVTRTFEAKIVGETVKTVTTIERSTVHRKR